MKPLIHLNYPINKDILLLESDRARENAKPWEGGHNYHFDEWLVSHHTSDYIKKSNARPKHSRKTSFLLSTT